MPATTDAPSIFETGLPTLGYDVTESPHAVSTRLRAAQQRAPIAIGPFGPEVLSYDLARSLLRASRFVIPPGLHLSVAQRYGSTTRFRQGFSGDGNYLEEVDLSVLGLPLTFLSTNLP